MPNILLKYQAVTADMKTKYEEYIYCYIYIIPN